MKKIIGGICILCIMGMGLPATYADEVVVETPVVDEKMMYDDMSYMYPESNFTLEKILWLLNGRNGSTTIEEEFDMISGNAVMEDYEYNSTHYYSKKLTGQVYIPETLERYIQKAQLKITREDSVPVMYDSTSMLKDTATTSPSKKTLSLDIGLDAFADGYSIDPSIIRDMIVDEYGNSFTIQVELVMTNGTVIPFSHLGYLYFQADNAEGKKAHLSNYYYSLNPGAGYPDLDSLLKVAFMKLRETSKDTETYVASLKKVRAKVDTFTEDYTKDIEKMVENINTEADFENIVKDYGDTFTRSNLLWDIGYRIDSEMLNDNAQKLIDELFTQE